MPKLCDGCGKKVSETLSVCPYCRQNRFSAIQTQTTAAPSPASPNLAPAGREIIGPMFTAYGFAAWFLVCEPDVIVAVRQSFWFAIASGLTIGAHPKQDSAPMLIYGLAGQLVANSGMSQQNKIASALAATSIAALRGNPRNVVWPVAQLSTITIKRPLFSNPELILVGRNGQKTVYGATQVLRFNEICERMAAMYGTLITTAGMTRTLPPAVKNAPRARR